MDGLPAAACSAPGRAASWGSSVCSSRRVACIVSSALHCRSQVRHAGHCSAGLDTGVVAAPARLGKSGSLPAGEAFARRLQLSHTARLVLLDVALGRLRVHTTPRVYSGRALYKVQASAAAC